MIDYTSHESLLGFEIEQLRQEDCQPSELADRFERLRQRGAGDEEYEQLWPLADSLAGTGSMEDDEPSDREQILATRPVPAGAAGAGECGPGECDSGGLVGALLRVPAGKTGRGLAGCGDPPLPGTGVCFSARRLHPR